MPHQARRTLLALALVAAARGSALAQPAVADKEACASAYEEGQSLRRQGKSLFAQSRFAACTQVCPAELVADCRRWWGEIAATLGTVMVEVFGPSGARAADARVTVDGRPIAIEAGIARVVVDPGAHEVIVEASAGRDRRVVDVSPGEQHGVEFRFAAAPQAPFATPGSPPTHLPTPAPPRDESPSRVLPIVVGAAGILGLGVGGVLGVKGHVDRSELESSCIDRCTDGQVDPIRTEWTIAAVSAGVGAAALGVAIVLWVASPRRRAAQSLHVSTSF